MTEGVSQAAADRALDYLIGQHKEASEALTFLTTKGNGTASWHNVRLAQVQSLTEAIAQMVAPKPRDELPLVTISEGVLSTHTPKRRGKNYELLRTYGCR